MYHLIRVIQVVKVSCFVRHDPYSTGSGQPMNPIPIRYRSQLRSMSGHMDGHVLGGNSEEPRAAASSVAGSSRRASGSDVPPPGPSLLAPARSRQ